jgi:hypothetical protein
MTKRGATREETTVYYDDDVHGLNEPTAEEVAKAGDEATEQSYLCAVAEFSAEHKHFDRCPIPLRDGRSALWLRPEWHSFYS